MFYAKTCPLSVFWSGWSGCRAATRTAETVVFSGLVRVVRVVRVSLYLKGNIEEERAEKRERERARTRSIEKFLGSHPDHPVNPDHFAISVSKTMSCMILKAVRVSVLP